MAKPRTKAVAWDPAVKALVDALLPGEAVKKLVLTIESGKLVTIEVTKFADMDGIQTMTEVVRRTGLTVEAEADGQVQA